MSQPRRFRDGQQGGRIRAALRIKSDAEINATKSDKKETSQPPLKSDGVAGLTPTLTREHVIDSVMAEGPSSVTVDSAGVLTNQEVQNALIQIAKLERDNQSMAKDLQGTKVQLEEYSRYINDMHLNHSKEILDKEEMSRLQCDLLEHELEECKTELTKMTGENIALRVLHDSAVRQAEEEIQILKTENSLMKVGFQSVCKAMTCPICSSDPRDHCLTCGHTFCKLCLCRWAEEQGVTLGLQPIKCMICRMESRPIELYDLVDGIKEIFTLAYGSADEV